MFLFRGAVYRFAVISFQDLTVICQLTPSKKRHRTFTYHNQDFTSTILTFVILFYFISFLILVHLGLFPFYVIVSSWACHGAFRFPLLSSHGFPVFGIHLDSWSFGFWSKFCPGTKLSYFTKTVFYLSLVTGAEFLLKACHFAHCE